MTSLIHPKRFGLKYEPIPTLALEYAEREEDENVQLEIVELPALHEINQSAEEWITQIQEKHHMFTSSLINMKQLQRLINKLKEETKAPSPEIPAATPPAPVELQRLSPEKPITEPNVPAASTDAQKETEEDDEHEQSFVSEDIEEDISEEMEYFSEGSNDSF